MQGRKGRGGEVPGEGRGEVAGQLHGAPRHAAHLSSYLYTNQTQSVSCHLKDFLIVLFNAQFEVSEPLKLVKILFPSLSCLKRFLLLIIKETFQKRIFIKSFCSVGVAEGSF